MYLSILFEKLQVDLMNSTFARAAALVVAALVLLAAATMGRAPESPRPLLYDKGTYSGSADTSLSEPTVTTLRRRTNNYRNSGILSRGEDV